MDCLLQKTRYKALKITVCYNKASYKGSIKSVSLSNVIRDRNVFSVTIRHVIMGK